MVLGLLADSHTIANLHDKPELTAHFPGPALWHLIESTADTTGTDPVPEAKSSRHVHEKGKFGRAGLTNRASEMPRYIYWVPESRGFGRWTRYDFLALSLMIRGCCRRFRRHALTADRDRASPFGRGEVSL